MKTNIQANVNATKWVLYLLVTFITVLLVGRANAQRNLTGPANLYVGVEGTMGTRSFHLNSDLANLKGINALQKGQTFGFIFGTDALVSKVRIGTFQSSSNDNSPLKLTNIEAGANFFPLQALHGKPRHFEPYLLASIDQSSVKATGTYTPTLIAPNSTPIVNGCGCPSNPGSGGSSGVLTDPDHPGVTGTPTSTEYAGKIITRRVNLGVGIRYHAVQGKHFLNLFAEVKQGLSIGTETTSPALIKTSSSSAQMSVDFGLAIGLFRNRSGGVIVHARRK